MTIEQNPPRSRVIQTRNQIGHRGFTRTARSDQRYKLPRLNFKRDAIQRPFPRLCMYTLNRSVAFTFGESWYIFFTKALNFAQQTVFIDFVVEKDVLEDQFTAHIR